MSNELREELVEGGYGLRLVDQIVCACGGAP